MGFENPVVGGTALRIPAIQSPGYTPGSAGWIIKIDGSAEFNNLTIRGVFLGTNFIFNASGLFLYSGTPAAGNLIASIAATGGTDSFTNAYLAGVVSYSGASFAALAAGNLLVGLTADGYPTAGLLGLSGVDGVFVTSPTGSDPDAATAAYVSGSVAVTPTSAVGYPHLDVGASSSGVTQWINGAVVYSTVNGGVSTAETWHTPSPFSANWAGTTTFGTISGGLGTLRYRIDAEDNLWILGTAVASAGAGAGVFNLPAAWRPKTNYPVPMAFISSGGVAGNAWAYVSVAGNLNVNSQLGGSVVAGTAYTFNGKVPLGNVG